MLRAALVGLALIAMPGLVQAQTAPTSSEHIVLPEMGEDELKFLLKKTNAYTGLLNDSSRGRESYARYLTWVNPKTGPTGKERIIYGLYSASPEIAARSADKVRDAARQPPVIERYDQAALKLASAYEALIPVMNEAEGYYEREDYKEDKMAGGQALHAKLMPLFAEFIAARKQMEQDVADVRQGLDQQILDKIEAKEGKSYRWHKRRIMMVAGKAIDIVPRDPKQKDLAAYDAAVADFARQVKEFDAYAATATDKTPFDAGFEMLPRSLLREFRQLRERAGKNEQAVFYDMSVNSVISTYNSMTSTVNNFGN